VTPKKVKRTSKRKRERSNIVVKPQNENEIVWDERLQREVAKILKEHKTLLERLAEK
jgi:hypothetical protein